MANLLLGQTSGGHDVLWFQERLGASASNSDSSDGGYTRLATLYLVYVGVTGGRGFCCGHSLLLTQGCLAWRKERQASEATT